MRPIQGAGSEYIDTKHFIDRCICIYILVNVRTVVNVHFNCCFRLASQGGAFHLAKAVRTGGSGRRPMVMLVQSPGGGYSVPDVFNQAQQAMVYILPLQQPLPLGSEPLDGPVEEPQITAPCNACGESVLLHSFSDHQCTNQSGSILHSMETENTDTTQSGSTSSSGTFLVLVSSNLLYKCELT